MAGIYYGGIMYSSSIDRQSVDSIETYEVPIYLYSIWREADHDGESGPILTKYTGEQ